MSDDQQPPCPHFEAAMRFADLLAWWIEDPGGSDRDHLKEETIIALARWLVK